MRMQIAVVLTAGLTLAACQTARTDSSREEQLEKRVAELERALVATSTPGASQAPATGPRVGSAAPRPARPATRPRPASRPAHVPARPALPVEPQKSRLALEPGSELELVLDSALSSRDARPGQPVSARVVSAQTSQGAPSLPGGLRLHGQVVEAQPAGRVKGQARLSVVFDELELDGRRRAIQASPLSVHAKSTGRDVRLVGGAAAAGGVIGAIADGKRGLGKGVLIGAGAGTATVLATRGSEAQLAAGSRWTVVLRSSVSF